ncbi:MAG: protein translocase subunit SecF [Acidimicrobiia bacterium]|nr:protein translocase subunit SecF [Acidimicrobiia bacterium]
MTATTVETRTGLLQTLRDIYHERTNFDFIGRSWLWGLVSGTAVVVSVAALVLSGLNLGIDFEGGAQWQFTMKTGTTSASEIRDVVTPLGITDAKILILGDNEARVQSGDLGGATPREVRKALAEYAGLDNFQKVSLTDVGPTWGDRVSSKALVALIVFFGLIALYLTMRFEWKMALAAIVAVVHDIAITVGVYAISGFEVTPATVIAFLTILGFSLYDTVVVFDKIRENTPSLGAVRGDTYSRMVNRSMNSVLMRSLNTSFVALLPVASLLVVGSGILGAVTLRDFALALFVGLFVGAYSSIFVATPILAWIKEREPHYQALRTRSMAQMAKAEVGERVASGALTPEDVTAGSVPPRAPGSITPRPRQQRRRRRR